MSQICFDTAVKRYTDIEYVQGLTESRELQNALYVEWKSYFKAHYRGVFFAKEEHEDAILHNTFTKLWLKVRDGRLYVKDGVLMYGDDKKLSSSLTTYMMGIAKLDNKELVRDISKMESIEEVESRMNTHRSNGGAMVLSLGGERVSDDSSDNLMRDVTAEVIANLSSRCSEVLTMFYYEEKSLDDILCSIDSFSSKDALKTFKNKCLNNLKVEARRRYNEYMNN